ncbi:MAG: ABC transporter permease [Clostridiales bacterium]|nr:ABC transporter permease [Clostridiales bacterium]
MRQKKPLSSYVEMLRTMLAIFFSLLIVFAIILLISEQPLSALADFVLGPLTSVRRFGNVIEAMTPLMFTGLAVIILFKPGLFNLAMEGAFFMGAVAACGAALTFKLPGVLNLAAAMVAAAVAGGLVCLIPGGLKVKCDANELVTSLMLNYICLYVGLWVITTFFYDPTQNSNYSYKFGDAMALPRLIEGTRINAGTVLAFVTVLVIWVLVNKLSFGFKANLVGENKNMADYVGISSGGIIILTQLIGGMLAGFGGAVELFGMYQRFQYSALPGYGWDGVLIAIVARRKVEYVPFAAFFLAYLRIGADIMSRNSDIPFEIVNIIQAVMVLLISATAILSGFKKRLIIREAKEEEEK